MRLGSICDLKIQSLERAAPTLPLKGFYALQLVQRSSASAHEIRCDWPVWIPEALRDELLEYAKGWRRMEREAKASPENRDLLFLTRFGNAYGRRGTDQSSAVNVEMSEFRKRGVKAELQVLRKFRFHQSRCTFGTELARLALSACADVAIVIATVSDALLHGPNSEATTFKYIRFVQALPIKQALSNSFMAAFSGIGAGARHDG